MSSGSAPRRPSSSPPGRFSSITPAIRRRPSLRTASTAPRPPPPSRLSAPLGPFAGYDENERPMLPVMQMHRDAVDEIDPSCPAYLSEAAREVWDECLASGRRHGYRNAQATVLAPTG